MNTYVTIAHKIDFPIVLIHILPLKNVQPLYSGQISCPQCVSFTKMFQCIANVLNTFVIYGYLIVTQCRV